MATLYKVDGTVRHQVTPHNGTDFSLNELYELLECELIDIISLSDGTIMVIDDEGKFNSDTNDDATDIALEHGAIHYDDWIAGNALVCKESEVL